MTLARMKTLIICRGPIAMEAMEVAAELGMPRPHLAVARREVYESAEGRAPWTEHLALYERLHIIDDYRDQDAIVAIARREGIDAVYVGYGYGAEDAAFIARLEGEGITPIAPPSEVMAFSSSKFRAKRHVREKLGIAVLPGSDRAAAMAAQGGASDEELIAAVTEEAEEILARAPGGTVRLKAAKGGGGKGQRLITRAGAAAGAAREIWAEVGARGVDGDKGILAEANLNHPRHWEIQILSDGETTVHFGGRECSIQNAGSQKFIEVSLHAGQFDRYLGTLGAKKDAGLIRLLRAESERVRETCDRAVRIMQSLGYRGAGTVEFLVAEDGPPEVIGRPHFMEINSRIQVEHRVSEAIARVRGRRVRLVGEQFRIAAGEKLGYTQEDIALEGYAVETRINAANSNFLIGASGSRIETYRVPARSEDFTYDDGGAAALFAGRRRRCWAVPNFDSNFGLAVFRGDDQADALRFAFDSLLDFDIRGNAQLRTTRAFHLGALGLLLGGAPFPAVRTDFSQVFLALGALAHRALGAIEEAAIAPGDPLRRLLAAGLAAMQDEPALGIALASVARRVDPAPGARELLMMWARLIPYRLRTEERALIEANGADPPSVVARVIEAVESVGVFDYRRRCGDLQLAIPEAVADARARRDSIDELRDTVLTGLAPRRLREGEIEDLRRALLGLDGAIERQVAKGGARESIEAPLRSCLDRLGSGGSISDAAFDALYRDLIRLKWAIRKAALGEEIARGLLAEVARAVATLRGPAVVAHLAGTVYLKPSPEAAPYVALGDEVEQDETVVALIENMKMFNEIRAHMTGRVKEIRVENERPVLPGEVLMVIE